MKVRILRYPRSIQRAYIVSPSADQDDEIVWTHTHAGTVVDRLCRFPDYHAQDKLESLLRRGYQISDGGPVPIVTSVADPMKVSSWQQDGSRAEIEWSLYGQRYHGGNAMTNRYLRLGCDMPAPAGISPATIWWTWNEYHGGPLKMTVASRDTMQMRLDEALRQIAQEIEPDAFGNVPWIPVLERLQAFPADEVRAVFARFTAACYASLREHQRQQAEHEGRVLPVAPAPLAARPGRTPAPLVPLPQRPRRRPPSLQVPPQRPRKIDLE